MQLIKTYILNQLELATHAFGWGYIPLVATAGMYSHPLWSEAGSKPVSRQASEPERHYDGALLFGSDAVVLYNAYQLMLAYGAL